MFSRQSPYVYSQDTRPARVLALYSGTFIGEIRLKPYLNALLGRGVIADYQIADRDMRSEAQSGAYTFSHIWCQRNVSTAQFAFLKAHSHVPIVYDMDDLLTSIPRFVASSPWRATRRLAWCLRQARAITVASERLAASLAGDAPDTGDKIVVLKNGCLQTTPAHRRDGVRQLVWTSSDVPFFLREQPQFATALADLLNRNDFEAVLIGRFDDGVRNLFKRSRHIGHLDFASYRQFLRTLAGAIAIAPMPTRLPAPAQRYFDAKSDVKLVDYLSSGLIPIVSDAPSYSTSELFIPELAASDADEMLERIEACIVDPKAAMQAIDEVIYRTALLNKRTFGELSRALDAAFA